MKKFFNIFSYSNTNCHMAAEWSCSQFSQYHLRYDYLAIIRIACTRIYLMRGWNEYHKSVLLLILRAALFSLCQIPILYVKAKDNKSTIVCMHGSIRLVVGYWLFAFKTKALSCKPEIIACIKINGSLFVRMWRKNRLKSHKTSEHFKWLHTFIGHSVHVHALIHSIHFRLYWRNPTILLPCSTYTLVNECGRWIPIIFIHIRRFELNVYKMRFPNRKSRQTISTFKS